MMRKSLFIMAVLLLFSLFKVNAQNYVYDFLGRAGNQNGTTTAIKGATLDVSALLSTDARSTASYEYWVKYRALKASNYCGIKGGVFDRTYTTADGTFNGGGFASAQFLMAEANVWQHWAVVFDNGVETLYKNGVAIDQKTFASSSFVNGIASGNKLVIGLYAGAPDMQVDEFRVWKTARTATQINQSFCKPYTELSVMDKGDVLFSMDGTMVTEPTTSYALDQSGNNGTATTTSGTNGASVVSVINTDIIMSKYPVNGTKINAGSSIQIGFLGNNIRPNTETKYIKINDATGNCLYSYNVNSATTNPYTYAIPAGLPQGNDYYITLDDQAFIVDGTSSSTTSIVGTAWKFTLSPKFSIDGDNSNLKLVSTQPLCRINFGKKIKTTTGVHTGHLDLKEEGTSNVVSLDLTAGISSDALYPYDISLPTPATSLLNPDKNYVAELVDARVIDIFGNVLTVTGNWKFHTEPKDLTATMVMANTVTPNSAIFSITINKPANIFWKCQEEGTAMPTIADLRNGSGTQVASSLVTPTVAYGITIPASSCIVGLRRQVYAVAIDLAGNPSELMAAEFTTTVPMVTLLTPTAGNYTATLSIAADRSGTAYFAVAQLGTTQPYFTTSTSSLSVSAANIGKVVYYTTVPTRIVLAKNTTYQAYVVFKDAAGNLTPTMAVTSFTTLNGTDVPTVSALTAKGYKNTATLSVTVTDLSTVYYQFTTDITATAPASSTLCASTEATVFNSNVNVAYVSTPIPVTGLLENTAYKVFVAAKNSAGVAANLASVYTFNTDGIKPLPSITSTGSISTSGATVNIAGSESGTLYYVILPASQTQPTTVASIINATASNNVIIGTWNYVYGVTKNVILTGLISGTIYNVYVVEVDNALNTSDNFAFKSFQTTGTPPVSILNTTSDFEVKVYPNPASDIVTVSYELAETTNVSIELYSISAQKVNAIEIGTQNAGAHSAQFDVTGLKEGVYIYKLNTSKGSTSKVLVIKH